MQNKLAIFDLDGTLLNTISDLGVAANHALKAMNLPTHPLDNYPLMVGNGVRRLIQRALPDNIRNDENVVDRALALFKDYYDVHLHDFTAPYAGISDLLQQLVGEGWLLAVASNKYQSATLRLINQFFGNISWAAILGAVPERQTKPNPAIVDEIIELTDIPRENVVFIGDSAIDIETARAAHVASVAVSWGFRPRSEIEAHNPLFIADCPQDLASHLANLASQK